MATRTSVGSGLWSAAGTWDTPPADNDTVVIALTHVVEFDIDTSSAIVWPNGINGMTITGTLKISRTTSSYLKMKAATTITGAGTFNVGESAALAVPFAVKCTITGGADWYINGASGLTMTVYAAEPAIKTIKTTALEPIGETVIAVDTSVVADIWADGDTIRIDDIAGGMESEGRVIAAGGIAAGTITITVGLTAAKTATSLLSLITRNVKFTGVGATGLIGLNFASGKLIVAGGQFTNAGTRIFQTCTGASISGGTFSGAYTALYACVSPSVTGGVFCGMSQPVYSSYGLSITGGTFSGNSSNFTYVDGISISGGIFSGGSSILNSCTGVSISGGIFDGNTYAVNTCAGANISGGTFTRNTAGLNASSAVIRNASFSANTRDIQTSVVTCFNVSLASTPEVYMYATLAREAYSESLDHDQSPGAFRSWTKGGITSSQAVTKPVGWTKAMQTTFENVASEGFWQREFTVGSLASVNIEMHLRKDAAMAYLPRCIIFNKAATDPFAGGAGIHTFTMTNSIDTWETETYTYYNSGAEDVTLVIRFQGMNAANNMYSGLKVTQINVDLTAALANIAVVDGIVDSILVDTGTDIPATLTTIDGVVDDILTDTGTTLPATLATIDGIADDILTDTGTTLPAEIAAHKPKLLIDGEIIV